MPGGLNQNSLSQSYGRTHFMIRPSNKLGLHAPRTHVSSKSFCLVVRCATHTLSAPAFRAGGLQSSVFDRRGKPLARGRAPATAILNGALRDVLSGPVWRTPHTQPRPRFPQVAKDGLQDGASWTTTTTTTQKSHLPVNARPTCQSHLPEIIGATLVLADPTCQTHC